MLFREEFFRKGLCFSDQYLEERGSNLNIPEPKSTWLKFPHIFQQE